MTASLWIAGGVLAFVFLYAAQDGPGKSWRWIRDIIHSQRKHSRARYILRDVERTVRERQEREDARPPAPDDKPNGDSR